MITQTAPTKLLNSLNVSKCVVLSKCMVLLLLVKFLLNQKHQYIVQWLNSLKGTQAVQNFGSVSESVVNQHYTGLDYMTQAWSWNSTKTWKNLIWCLSAGKTQNYAVQESINLYWRYTECTFCANECCLEPCFSK